MRAGAGGRGTTSRAFANIGKPCPRHPPASRAGWPMPKNSFSILPRKVKIRPRVKCRRAPALWDGAGATAILIVSRGALALL